MYTHICIFTCKYIHIYIYTYTYTYIHVHIYIYIYTYIHIYILYTHVHIYTYTHIRIHAYAHLYTCTCVHMYTCTHVHMYTCTHVHIHTYTHTHMYTCTHTHVHTLHTYTHIHTPPLSALWQWRVNVLSLTPPPARWHPLTLHCAAVCHMTHQRRYGLWQLCVRRRRAARNSLSLAPAQLHFMTPIRRDGPSVTSRLTFNLWHLPALWHRVLKPATHDPKVPPRRPALSDRTWRHTCTS